MAARSESDKAQEEIDVLRRFIQRSGEPLDASSIEKRAPREPDLLCKGVDELIAFEISALCDEELAKILAAGPRARTDAFSTADPSAEIVRRKLNCSYETNYPIELLLHTDGRIITPDDVIISTVRPILESRKGPFRRAWFMGEKITCLLWEVYQQQN